MIKIENSPGPSGDAAKSCAGPGAVSGAGVCHRQLRAMLSSFAKQHSLSVAEVPGKSKSKIVSFGRDYQFYRRTVLMFRVESEDEFRAIVGVQGVPDSHTYGICAVEKTVNSAKKIRSVVMGSVVDGAQLIPSALLDAHKPQGAQSTYTLERTALSVDDIRQRFEEVQKSCRPRSQTKPGSAASRPQCKLVSPAAPASVAYAYIDGVLTRLAPVDTVGQSVTVYGVPPEPQTPIQFLVRAAGEEKTLDRPHTDSCCSGVEQDSVDLLLSLSACNNNQTEMVGSSPAKGQQAASLSSTV